MYPADPIDFMPCRHDYNFVNRTNKGFKPGIIKMTLP